MENVSHQTSSNQVQYASDEIDLVELLAMVWRLRYAAVGGAAVGLLGGLGFVGMRSPTYETTLPVTVLRDSLPANTDSKKLVEMYTSALGAPDIAAAAFTALEKASPQFATNLKDAGLSVSDLVRAQTAIENVGKPTKSMLRLTASASASDFFVTMSLPVRGFGAGAREAVLNAFNAAGNAYNNREERNYVAQTQGALSDVLKNTALTIGKQEVALVQAYALQARIKGELAEIEYGLQRIAGSDSVNFARLVQAPPVNVVISSADGKIESSGASRTNVSPADFERISRLKAMAVHDKRMSEKESADLDGRLARLQVKAQRMRAELEPLIVSIESGRDLVAKAQRAAMTSIDRTSQFVPLFTFDSVTNPTEAKLVKFEQSGGKMLPVAGGTFLGGMLGFFAMALFKFVRKNQKRIAELVAGD